jgi:methionyl-tRNA formyltransferase
MRMDAGLDTGPMLLKQAVGVGEATAGELASGLSALGAQLMVQALAQLSAGTLRETAQPAEGVTYAAKISKDEARIDWGRPAAEIARAVRAFNPAPVAWTLLDGERVRLWRAAPVAGAAGDAPGTILAADGAGLRVATGEGVLAITELQLAGGRAMSAQQAVAGRSWTGRRLA